jgi:hypothetical protein
MTSSYTPALQPVLLIFFALHFMLQLFLPVRYLLYPGKLFWTEQGYRFSWRVMLMEKNGYTSFIVKDDAGSIFSVNKSHYLTALQDKMMSTQPDMILQFAHFIADEYKKMRMRDPQVYVEAYVSVNGSRSRLFIDSTVDLARQQESFCNKKWILPFEQNR